MKKHTYRDRLIAGLVALGYQQQSSKTAKYTVFRKPNFAVESTLFVGPYGALRVGRNSTNSRSVGDPSTQGTAYKHILAAGDAALTLTPSPLPTPELPPAGDGAGSGLPES